VHTTNVDGWDKPGHDEWMGHNPIRLALKNSTSNSPDACAPIPP
jgi:hypothetical protein